MRIAFDAAGHGISTAYRYQDGNGRLETAKEQSTAQVLTSLPIESDTTHGRRMPSHNRRRAIAGPLQCNMPYRPVHPGRVRIGIRGTEADIEDRRAMWEAMDELGRSILVVLGTTTRGRRRYLIHVQVPVPGRDEQPCRVLGGRCEPQRRDGVPRRRAGFEVWRRWVGGEVVWLACPERKEAMVDDGLPNDSPYQVPS